MSDTQEARKQFAAWKKTLPKCIGGEEGCDGSLVGEPHEENCPMFGKEFATHWDAFEAGWEAALSRSAEPTRTPTVIPLDFDDWWESDGKFFDPDTDDVPWYDKRRFLAEYAFMRAKSFMQQTLDLMLEHQRKYNATEELESRSSEPTEYPKGWREGFVGCHIAPAKDGIADNKVLEPIGERIRQELIDFLNRNGIVGILLDTEMHNVNIQIAKLPPEIKPVLTHWGSIYVRNEEKYLQSRSAEPREHEAQEELRYIQQAITQHYGKLVSIRKIIEDLKELESRSPSTDDKEFYNETRRVMFRAGLLACREYMARFVESESPSIAASIRANWWPCLGDDPGSPRPLRFDEVTDGGENGPWPMKEISPSIEALPVARAFLVNPPIIAPSSSAPEGTTEKI